MAVLRLTLCNVDPGVLNPLLLLGIIIGMNRDPNIKERPLKGGGLLIRGLH